MSIFASFLRGAYKLSGAKKAFALPEDALRKEIEKQNRHRGVFTPTDRKAYYETIAVNGFPCLIVREHPKPSERAILYFFGGGMVIGPDKGDLPVMRKLCRETGCDVWFPFYPLCMEHCITETYAMVYECYRKMITLYGGGNVSTCGFSSGGALALGIAAHNNAQPEPLPQPRHIVAVSPGEVPWNDAERARMQALNKRDVSIDYAFMVTVEKFMRHGCENVPDYMLSGSRGDFTGVGDIHFFYSADEVLYGALPDFEEACKRANVPYTVSARPKMVHCYCMLPIFKEAKEDFAFLDALPGARKLLLKGNHDYWWNTAAKMNRFFAESGFSTLHILHNNCYEYGGYALCGTRGWFYEEDREGHGAKIFNRELIRLEASLKAAGEREKYCFLHYPPLYQGYRCQEIIDLLERYQVSRCFYGHLHGGSHRLAISGRQGGVEYDLVSADYLGFQPKKILD